MFVQRVNKSSIFFYFVFLFCLVWDRLSNRAWKRCNKYKRNSSPTTLPFMTGIYIFSLWYFNCFFFVSILSIFLMTMGRMNASPLIIIFFLFLNTYVSVSDVRCRVVAQSPFRDCVCVSSNHNDNKNEKYRRIVVFFYFFFCVLFNIVLIFIFPEWMLQSLMLNERWY